MNRFRIHAARLVAAALVAASLTACGGGGGGGATGGPPPGAPSVSGDMVAYQANRGWNYHGTIQGTAVTVSVYADPQQNGVDPLIGFGGTGTAPNAFAGTKLAGIGVQNTGSGYIVGSYVLLNSDGSTYAAGTIPGNPTLVPSTLVQGQSFATYPGVTAIVQTVGTVPGASACPTPATGATVQYTYVGQTYLVSYVPGCGITQYVGNHGEVLTLASVGTYQLGTQSTRRMDTLTTLDTLRSAASVLMSHQLWRPFAR